MGMVINFYYVFFLHSGDCFHNGFVRIRPHDPIVKQLERGNDLQFFIYKIKKNIYN